jgi:four helix bundle protein
MFPSAERFGLVAHLNKTAGSISFNIAEGFGRESHSDLARFLQYAKGSANELEAQLLLARDTGMIGNEAMKLLRSVADVRRMLVGLLKEVRRQAN